MRLRQMIGLGIVLVVLLFITASYVSYSQKMELFDQRGGWFVKAEGRVYLTGGEVYAVISTFRAWYDSTPDLPSYGEHLGNMFDIGSDKPTQVSENDTFVTLRVVISYSGEGIGSRELLDDSQKIPYRWAGGDIGTSGEIGSFNFQLGPYVAYHEFSPLKITCQATVGTSKVVDAFYLTIPELETLEVTDG